MSTRLKAIWAALSSAVIAFLTSLITAVQGEHAGFNTVTASQWLTAVLAFFVAVAGTGTVTYRVRNRPLDGNHGDGDASEPDIGAASAPPQPETT